MTDKQTPTDAELEALLLDKLPASKHYIRPVIEKMVAAMQAAIDKWGTPATVGVGEVAEHYRNAIASACEGWTMPDGLRKHLETALWSQPTHAQPVARVPLDEARRMFDAGWKAAALFCDREDVVADGIIGFGACPQFEAAFSAANDIKGG